VLARVGIPPKLIRPMKCATAFAHLREIGVPLFARVEHDDDGVVGRTNREDSRAVPPSWMTKSSAETSISGRFLGSVTIASATRLAPVCESGVAPRPSKPPRAPERGEARYLHYIEQIS